MTTNRFLLLTAILALVANGCKELPQKVDLTPPSPPTGLWTETGDDFIELFWTRSGERDVAGYNVFASSRYNGEYELIGSSKDPYFLDDGARNGNVYYYAVTAYDFDGNESKLSIDVVYDIPRPEGYDVMLDDYRRYPSYAGYDFSEYTIRPYDAQLTDMYFENYAGVLYMNVRTDTDIQDMGYTRSLLDVREAPASGWSPTHDVRLTAGHTYIVWTWDDHYAKFRVTSLSQGRVTFDWAYQLVKANPLLKRPGNSSAGRTTGHEERTR